jgi:hypothetical protein
MSIKSADYDALLAELSDRQGAIALLRGYRSYLEMIPSLRRAQDSVITIPLPIMRVRLTAGDGAIRRESIQLPCDLAILMCDPEWKIKMGSEILVFIHRPEEGFSELLIRWRQTQVYLEQEYEWIMPPQEQHMFSEGADRIYPLFVLFEETPVRIKRGLAGACLPYLVQSSLDENEEDLPECLSDCPQV